MTSPPRKSTPVRTVMFVTGSRADYGLLRPVIAAARADRRLRVRVVASGEHLLAPARTVRLVHEDGDVHANVPMQRGSDRGRLDHAQALARGVQGFARAIAKLKPHWTVVLGDRIEAFAAASASAVAGVPICHIHGGDRAEGIADEAMRHAITKLAQLHCAASKGSAQRITTMGEPARTVHVTGSPAIDPLRAIDPMTDQHARDTLGRAAGTRAVILVHPDGRDRADLEAMVRGALMLAWSIGTIPLVLAPNSDPGREHIVLAYERAQRSSPLAAHLMERRDHLPREAFIALLKRLAKARPAGVLIGNSSAGLIEAAAIGLTCVNIGPRQNGRERADNVIDVPSPTGESLARVSDLLQAPSFSGPRPTTLFGQGNAGARIARLLATFRPDLRKHNTY